jgi:hypothetical protein
MNDKREAGMSVFRVAGLAIEGVLLGLLAYWLASRVTGHPSAATAIGWMTTLAAVSVGAILSYVLARDDVSDSRSSTDTAQCGNCGHVVADDWRLCPYCGTFVDDRSSDNTSRANDVAVR